MIVARMPAATRAGHSPWFLHAFVMASWRRARLVENPIVSCHPLSAGAGDPVPAPAPANIRSGRASGASAAASQWSRMYGALAFRKTIDK
jgi:hypothetical protein